MSTPSVVNFHLAQDETNDTNDFNLADVELGPTQPRAHTSPVYVQAKKAAVVAKTDSREEGEATEAHRNSIIDSSDESRLPPVQITYKNIKFAVDVKHDKKTERREILKGCDGHFAPGRLTAVMGASGAGKTSLMNLISGNPTAGHTSGSICLNGTEVWDDMARIRELSAYIQQDDILLATQTVREAVTLSARLRLPKSMSDEEKLRRVDETIEILGLGKCVDTIIGDAFNKGVSGGEKRRVSMALELIKSPAILFLDEPTSGLDTYTAHSIVGLLRDIAHNQGKTIVCTIHQPSSDVFRMFDDLCLLADGQVMYHGRADAVVGYFNARGLVCPENFNPADHLFMKVLYSMDEQLKMVHNDLASTGAGSPHAEGQGLLADREAATKEQYEKTQAIEKERVAALLTEWKASSEHAVMQAAIHKPLTSALPDPTAMRAERPGMLYAFRLLAVRRWHDLLRDRMKLRVQIFQYLFFSIILGLIFLRTGHGQNSVQDRTGCLFFVSVQALFMSFMSNLNTFGPEKLVMMREMESGMYSLSPYFFSRWIVELPFRCVLPFMYSVILYFMVGFQMSGEKFILFAIALVLIDNCGTNMAVMICSVFPDVQTAMQAGPAFILPLMVFSGFYVNIATLGWWFRWISYISPIRYGYTAIIKNEMYGLEFDCDRGVGAPCVRTGEEMVRSLGVENDPGVGLNLVILIILLGGFLMGAFLFMKRTTMKK